MSGVLTMNIDILSNKSKNCTAWSEYNIVSAMLCRPDWRMEGMTSPDQCRTLRTSWAGSRIS